MSEQTKQIGQAAWDAVHNHGAFRRDFPNDDYLEAVGVAVLAAVELTAKRTRAEAWFAGYDKGNLDGYFGTRDERAASPYAEFDPYRENGTTEREIRHEDWCHTVTGCTEPSHCTCENGSER